MKITAPLRAALAIAAIASLSALDSARAQSARDGEGAKTEAALRLIQTHWSDAEARGDTAYLNALLLPEYQSVNVDGTVHPKSALMANATRHIGSDVAVKQLAAWRAAHTHGTTIVITDDTAVMSYYNPALGPMQGVTSADILVYRDHHWHAIYSSHTSAAR